MSRREMRPSSLSAVCGLLVGPLHRKTGRREDGYPYRLVSPLPSGLLQKAYLLYGAAVLIALGACSPPPPIVSADTSCERFAHISATDAQIKVFQDNWDVMETYADSIVAHNIEYDKSCLGPVKP